jgi:hypothetical protein
MDMSISLQLLVINFSAARIQPLWRPDCFVLSGLIVTKHVTQLGD